ATRVLRPRGVALPGAALRRSVLALPAQRQVGLSRRRGPAASTRHSAMPAEGCAMRKPIDLTGKRVGYWLVIAMLPGRYMHRGRPHGVLCVARCICDRIRIKKISELRTRTGGSTNCGCVGRELTRKACTKHGMSKSRIYKLWASWKQRCYNPKNLDYPNYRHRGYEPWKSFVKFYADVSALPDFGL